MDKLPRTKPPGMPKHLYRGMRKTYQKALASFEVGKTEVVEEEEDAEVVEDDEAMLNRNKLAMG